MKWLFVAVVVVVASCASGEDGVPTPVIWADDFDGPMGSPDPVHWSFDVGGDGWGNGELQHYTARPENAALDGDGHLVITARQETFAGSDYTSARLNTRGHFAQAFGRFEARMKLPAGKGLWPAFWLLGADLSTAGWPGCGELDVMEARGSQPNRVTASVHGPGYAGGQALIAGYEQGTSFANDFHIYAVDWTPDYVRFSVDGTTFHTVKATRLPAGARWVFDHPFFMVLDLAVGGTFGGAPDATTNWPQTLVVDYVRVHAPSGP